MKKLLFLLCATALFALSLGACAPKEGTAAPGAGEESEVKSGAYSDQRALKDEEKTLFETVMKDHAEGKTYEPVSVATQVVAGKNYKFLAKVTEDGAESEVYVVIFEPLPNSGKEPSFTEETPVSSGEMTGAYGEQRALKDEEKTLFETVMKDHAEGKTYEPVSVATQVVAGTNYKFLAKVTEGGAESEAYVVIFEPLPNTEKEPEFVSETAK